MIFTFLNGGDESIEGTKIVKNLVPKYQSSCSYSATISSSYRHEQGYEPDQLQLALLIKETYNEDLSRMTFYNNAVNQAKKIIYQSLKLLSTFSL